MNRRELFKISIPAAFWAFLPPFARTSAANPAERYLFFHPEDIDRIRVNARTPLLRPVYEEWSAENPDDLLVLVAQVQGTDEWFGAFRSALNGLSRASVVQLVEPTAAREAAIIEALGMIFDFPTWDPFLDGDQAIGIQRASQANSQVLFAREVLAGRLEPAFEAALLHAVAEKGCVPLHRAIYGMDHPETVTGWRPADDHADLFFWDMSRWPLILGENNLRAVPTTGLGLGALALEGHDERAGEWLARAVSSAKHFLGILSPDGSYNEGLSYIDYALRTLLTFCDAHQRLHGTVAWKEEANFPGVADYIAVMQAGFGKDGRPEIVNFSDAWRNVYPCVPSWIAKETGSPLAQYAVENFTWPGDYMDFPWYDPDRPAAPPPDRLKNAHLDLDWVICRTGWDADDAVLAFRSGPPQNHEHADRNSLLFKIYGERLLNDHRNAGYDSREPGWILRLTEAHNAVLVDGKGHQYHQGEEGTNASLAEAEILRFVDEGERVWWCSDATHGYHLVDENVDSVVRTVAFAKPNVIILHDRVALKDRPARMEVRFFPDNEDGTAALELGENAFQIQRPNARLYGFSFGRQAPSFRTAELDLPDELGSFPFVEVTSPAALEHEIVTILVAHRTAEASEVQVSVEHDDEGWDFAVDDVRGRFDTSGDVVEVRWG